MVGDVCNYSQLILYVGEKNGKARYGAASC
jgi:hypothetical protein